MTYLIFDGLYLLVLYKKRRKTCNHFENDVTKSPPIHCEANVHAFFEGFRGHVLWGSSDGVSQFEMMGVTTESEVDYSDESIFVNEYILRFEAEL